MWQMSELSDGGTRRGTLDDSAQESTRSEVLGRRLRPPMPTPSALHGEYAPAWRLSIRTKLLIAVNGVLLIGLAALLVWDFQRGLTERLNNKQTSMAEEAALILSALETIRDQGVDAMQAYIDRACIQMQDSKSPGHHIAAQIDDMLLQAQSHHRASPDFAKAMQQAAAALDHQANVAGKHIIVGSRRSDGVVVYVSEFTGNIRDSARALMRYRAGAMAVVGIALTAIVNFVLVRIVTQPIGRMAETVRRIGEGDLGVEPQRSTTTELDELATEIGAMSRALAKAQENRVFQMDKARRIQHHLLPCLSELQSVGIHHVHLPAEDVGGDFLDVQVIDERRVAIYAGDVSGHGVPAAMSASMLKVLIDSGGTSTDLAEALAKINRRFHAVTLEGHFATMFMCEIDRGEGQLAYASAGHETAYLVRKNDSLEELEATGMLLGVDPDTGYEVILTEVSPGDLLILLTDGIVETMSPAGELLGRQAVVQALSECGNKPPRQVAEQLVRLAEHHRAGEPQHDDITVAVLRV